MPPFAGEAMSLACALCWAVAVLLFRRVGPADPRALNLFKNALASVLLCLTLLAMGRGIDLDRSAEDWWRLLGSSLLGLTLGDTLFFMGLQRIGASVAAVTDCTYSPIVLVLSVFLLGETVSSGLVFGAPLVVAGLLLVSWQPRAQVAAERVDRLGVLLAVGGVAATALGAVMAKPVLERSDLVEATTVRLLFATATLLVWQAATGRLKSSLQLFTPQAQWRWLVPGAVAGTYVSMLLWLGGYKYTSAGTAALLNQMATVFLLGLSATVGGEIVPPRRWAGAGLAMCGALAVLAGGRT